MQTLGKPFLNSDENQTRLSLSSLKTLRSIHLVSPSVSTRFLLMVLLLRRQIGHDQGSSVERDKRALPQEEETFKTPKCQPPLDAQNAPSVKVAEYALTLIHTAYI